LPVTLLRFPLVGRRLHERPSHVESNLPQV
jgi:hypothetical protein